MRARRASRLFAMGCAALLFPGFLIGAVLTEGVERLLCINGHPAPRPARRDLWRVAAATWL